LSGHGQQLAPPYERPPAAAAGDEAAAIREAVPRLVHQLSYVVGGTG
jgi:hypothetical protein